MPSRRDRLTVIAGPCVITSGDAAVRLAVALSEMSKRAGVDFVFKASYDKANRTSALSYRGPGIKAGLEVLRRVREEVGCHVTTDVHRDIDVPEVASVVDLVQVPAFLCRQTDLLVAAGDSGVDVNVKKGQFAAPASMAHAIEKVRLPGKNQSVWLTERGTTFGHGDLVVDMRGLRTMRLLAGCDKVIFDATHSCQTPGSLGASTGGDGSLAMSLARAAVATGWCDGVFMEVKEPRLAAACDNDTSVPLDDDFFSGLGVLRTLWELSNKIGGGDGCR